MKKQSYQKNLLLSNPLYNIQETVFEAAYQTMVTDNTLFINLLELVFVFYFLMSK